MDGPESKEKDCDEWQFPLQGILAVGPGNRGVGCYGAEKSRSALSAQRTGLRESVCVPGWSGAVDGLFLRGGWEAKNDGTTPCTQTRPGCPQQVLGSLLVPPTCKPPSSARPPRAGPPWTLTKARVGIKICSDEGCILLHLPVFPLFSFSSFSFS